MLRFNKTTVLALLIATSSVFLLFQLYHYRQHVSQNGPHIFGRTVHLSGKDTQWQVVKKFMGLVHKYNLPVFLVDTASLGLLSQDSMLLRDGLVKEPHCNFLCTNRDVRGKDPRLVSMDDLSGNEIPLHFLFRLQGYVVHVVVLYERSGNYLWHGALRLKPNMDRKPELVMTTLDGLDLYPDDTSPEAMNFRMKAKALLHLAARTLTELRVPFWLSSGTCL
ncbi:unnamed protein product, partial [Coregonus sp. 'balchen']